MNYVNGAAHSQHESTTSAAVISQATADAHGEPLSLERRKEIKVALEVPFDPGEIKWRVTATVPQQTKRGPQKRGQVVAYADQRAYTDRLNAIFGEWGWTRSYDVQVAQNFERKSPGDKTQTAISAKVVVVSRVTIHQLGTHTGVGEEWADDENAATRAEAQSFKRACACFGLGRYLYDVEKVWVDLDQHNRPTETPRLPDWACPHNAKRSSPRSPTQPRAVETGGNAPRNSLVQQEMLTKVREMCEQAGHSLSQFTLTTYGGVTDPAKLGFARLTTVFEKLSDLVNGIARLERAKAAVGDERYAQLCRHLRLPSDSLDDIPNREALRSLLAHAEAEANKQVQPVTAPTARTACIATTRSRLLRAARKAAENPRSGWPPKLGEVIRRASGGTLTLDMLRDLTDGDVPTIESFIATIEGGVD